MTLSVAPNSSQRIPQPVRPASGFASKARKLSEEHRREIVEGSDIPDELVDGRYFSVTAAESRALGFSGNQARDGWVVELLSPGGELSYQLKPDTPRVDKGKPVKYETRAGHDIVIDVHPRNHKCLISNPKTPIWITEGTKKADCLAGRGQLAIALSGVWNWGKKRKRGGAKYGRPELLPDWDVVPLEGRTAYVVFDADYREKQNVALALLRLCERLTERGALVYVISLPGPDKGVDDYLVAGGTLETLQAAAVPFRSTDLIPYAAKPDKRIWGVVGSILEAMRTDEWTQRGAATSHSLLRALLELALVGGRYDREADAVELVMGTRELRQCAAIGSPNTLSRHTALLGERGYLESTSGDRHTGKANHYLLKLSKGVPLIERGGEVSTYSITGTQTDNLVPHFRWPAPPAPEDKPFAETASVHEPMKALGKLAELALSLLTTWGGKATLRDLSGATGMNHTAKMREKLSDLLEAGVIGMDPRGKHRAEVWLVDGWERRVLERQEDGGELARARRQAKKHRENRLAYATDGDRPADKAPGEADMQGPEYTAEVLEKHKARWRAEEAQQAAVELERAETFLLEVLSREKVMERGYIRYGLLLEMWKEDHGGTDWHFRRAMSSLKLTVRRHDEYPDELFVYRPEPAPQQAEPSGLEPRLATENTLGA
jgi:hypothetical protein